MSNTPTTEEVRTAYIHGVGCSTWYQGKAKALLEQFDRWLFHMQEDAWDRGYQAGIVDSPYSSPRIILTAKEVEQLNKALDREEDA